jgi:nitric oxide reductase subunit C
MVKGILSVLLLCFGCYTASVYLYCDEHVAPVHEQAKRGWEIWQAKNCQSCHQVYGLGGYLGPDLTNVAAKRDSKYLHTYIKYGTGRMPNFGLSDREVDDVAAWLQWVDKTGQSKVPKGAVHWTGTYVLDGKK